MRHPYRLRQWPVPPFVANEGSIAASARVGLGSTSSPHRLACMVRRVLERWGATAHFPIGLIDRVVPPVRHCAVSNHRSAGLSACHRRTDQQNRTRTAAKPRPHNLRPALFGSEYGTCPTFPVPKVSIPLKQQGVRSARTATYLAAPQQDPFLDRQILLALTPFQEEEQE